MAIAFRSSFFSIASLTSSYVGPFPYSYLKGIGVPPKILIISHNLSLNAPNTGTRILSPSLIMLTIIASTAPVPEDVRIKTSFSVYIRSFRRSTVSLYMLLKCLVLCPTSGFACAILTLWGTYVGPGRKSNGSIIILSPSHE